MSKFFLALHSNPQEREKMDGGHMGRARCCWGGRQGSAVVDARRQRAAAGTARDRAARRKAGKESMQRLSG